MGQLKNWVVQPVILNSATPEATNGVEDQNYRLQFLDGIFVNILRTKKTPRRGVYLWLSLIGKWIAVVSHGSRWLYQTASQQALLRGTH